MITDEMLAAYMRAFSERIDADILEMGEGGLKSIEEARRSAIEAAIEAGGMALVPKAALAAGQQPVAWTVEGNLKDGTNTIAKARGSVIYDLANDTWANAYFPLYAAPVPAKAGGVRVKPLEWRRPSFSETLSRADSIVGTYRVWTHREAAGKWFWRVEGVLHGDSECDDEQSAKYAAQSHYEAAILSAIEPGESAWVITEIGRSALHDAGRGKEGE